MCSNNAVEQAAGPDPVLGRAGRGAGRAPRPLGVPVGGHAGARHLRGVRTGRTCARRAPSGSRPGGCSPWPGWAWTTWRTSTCTRASPRRCRSRAAEIGLGLDRPLTVTGGLSFAGGPWNNYVTHSVATMAGVLRDGAGCAGPGHRQRRLRHQARPGPVLHRAAPGRLPGRGRAARRGRAPPPRGVRGARRRRHHRVVGGRPRPGGRPRAGPGRLPHWTTAAGPGPPATTPTRWPSCARARSRSAAPSSWPRTAPWRSEVSVSAGRAYGT